MKKAIMYGAGSIGRGFIGQLFSESGYEVSFIDVNETVIDRLNADGEYPIYITAGDHYEQRTVRGVRGINGRDEDAVAEAVAEADIMATAVGVNVLRHIAAPVAAGIRLRCARGIETPLNIIICENMLEADRYFSSLVRDCLSPREQTYFDRCVAAVEPSIGRMVPATPKELSERNPLAVCVEAYCELPVDRAAFKGEIPPIQGMIPFSPFDFYIRRKLFMHNMSHALTAYLGAGKGYTYIWEAAEDPAIKLIALRALTESSRALSAEYGVPLGELLEFSENLLSRFENRLLADTVERVGRDTARKLSENDRFVGAAKLCLRHGIEPANICAGLAAGLRFAPEGDEASCRVKAEVSEKGVAAVMQTLCGIGADSPLVGRVCAAWDRLERGIGMPELIRSLEIF